MATSNDWADSSQSDTSAVIEMTDSMEDFGGPSREPAELHTMDIHDGEDEEEHDEETGDFMKAMRSQIGQEVAGTAWKAGKDQARKVFDLYANIDIFRPYFDVEPKVVVRRLIFSLVPKRPSGRPQKVETELYGPLMVVFTLIAFLLMEMKSSSHVVREGTLMGSAIGLCFGYWFIASGLFYTVAYICNTQITPLQVLSLTGYSQFANCIVIFLGTALHNLDSHFFFYMMWAIFGGLSALKMSAVYFSRTSGKTQKLLIAGIVSAVHLLFLLYLHFAYHQIVKDISNIIDGAPGNQPMLDVVERGAVDEHVNNVEPQNVEIAEHIVKEAMKTVTKAAKIVNLR
ncbi:protein YIPF3-like isoform X2 [Anneissia japonica]|uniref:protein YIPF3-like isoform X2 n=1 Tax=Anneissia japonica TaxID=1529436 RepID=UPI00142566B9|nr:protein YIPF3-like isoform X2 [Anneissia japonica]